MEKTRPRDTKKLVLVLLFIISLLINIVFISLYFIKLLPRIKNLQAKVVELENNTEKKDCQRVYSQSRGEFVCLADEELKANALSACSRTVITVIDKLEGFQIDNLKKTKDLFMEICMEAKGYKYK